MKTLFMLFIFLIPIHSFSTIINIPDDYTTIQEGIDAATHADTVLVQPGTYVENINYNGKNITVASLFLTTADTTYISQTIIDGDQNGSVVTFENEEDSTAVLTGFTIMNGLWGGGGGIYLSNSNPSLVYLTILNNSVVGFTAYRNGLGGGIYCNNNSSPSLENVTITGNSADWGDGGGIYCSYNSNPSLVNVTITNNSAGASGGGIYCNNNSSPSLVNVTITNNSAGDWGGGIYCLDNSNPSLVNVTITDNSAGKGGGISCRFSSCPSLENVTISENSVNYNGGGILCSASSPNLVNVTISGNSADWGGGGIWCVCSSPSLVNVTISGNTAIEGGGGIYCGYISNPILVNCMLWNDSPQEVYFWEDYDSSSITISYSDIQGGEEGIVTNDNGTVYWLEGNIDEDPLFVETGYHPYSLLEGSPCIDAGTPDTLGLNLPPWDIIGNERIWDGDGDGTAIIDMGAYEYGAPPYVEIDEDTIVQTPGFHLYQNCPNPFNPTTTISYQLSEISKVSLKVYNIKGQLVRTLVDDTKPSGQHSVIWKGTDQKNLSVPSGVYLYRLKTNNKSKIKKMILIR